MHLLSLYYVYKPSISCLLCFLCRPYIPILIRRIFTLLVVMVIVHMYIIYINEVCSPNAEGEECQRSSCFLERFPFWLTYTPTTEGGREEGRERRRGGGREGRGGEGGASENSLFRQAIKAVHIPRLSCLKMNMLTIETEDVLLAVVYLHYVHCWEIVDMHKTQCEVIIMNQF